MVLPMYSGTRTGVVYIYYKISVEFNMNAQSNKCRCVRRRITAQQQQEKMIFTSALPLLAQLISIAKAPNRNFLTT